jgi:hypothetical protein
MKHYWSVINIYLLMLIMKNNVILEVHKLLITSQKESAIQKQQYQSQKMSQKVIQLVRIMPNETEFTSSNLFFPFMGTCQKKKKIYIYIDLKRRGCPRGHKLGLF